MTKEVDVTVKPVASKGNEVFCEISPGTNGNSNVKGGIIKLSKSDSYTLKFTLANGNPAGLQFDQANPFCSKVDGCPSPNDQTSQFQNPQVKPDGSLTVSASPSEDTVVHYRLNFKNGQRSMNCDPIIINE